MSVLTFALRNVQRLVPRRFDLAFNSVRIRFEGGGESESWRVRDLSQRFRTAIDIGANRGEYTFQMSRVFNSVWSFEPNTEVAQPIISARIANVCFIPVALSSSEGTASLTVPIVNGYANHGLGSIENHKQNEQTRTFEVPLRTLDSFNISDVDFIKMDVEGHEMKTLRGAAETIDKWRPICLVELVGDHQSEVLEFFRALGYEPHREWKGIKISDHNRLLVPRT
jgi:FkbM family methyltransferase